MADRYVCLECNYIYDPARGDQKGGIPPGTPFEKLPANWHCPECGISIQKRGIFKKVD
jgi:rubredoxin